MPAAHRAAKPIRRVGKEGRNFTRFFKSLDIFGEPVTFNVRGYTEFKTKFGAFMTLIMLTLSAIYFILQVKIMLSYGDTKHTTTVSENALDLTRKFDIYETSLDMVFIMAPMKNEEKDKDDEEKDDGEEKKEKNKWKIKDEPKPHLKDLF